LGAASAFAKILAMLSNPQLNSQIDAMTTLFILKAGRGLWAGWWYHFGETVCRPDGGSRAVRDDEKRVTPK